MKAYSFDFPLKILAVVDADMNNSRAARTFGVGLSTVKRYVRQRVSNPTMSRMQRRVVWTRKKDRNRKRARRGTSCCLVGGGHRA